MPTSGFEGREEWIEKLIEEPDLMMISCKAVPPFFRKDLIVCRLQPRGICIIHIVRLSLDEGSNLTRAFPAFVLMTDD